MEHIGKVLGNLETETNIPQTVLDPELTVIEKREQLRQSLGVTSLDNTFESFDPVVGTAKVLATFKSLASGKTTWKMTLCYGGVGSGKTHLCEATAIELYKRGLFGRVLTMDRMMGVLKECIGSDQSLDELLRRYGRAERLILDDVDGTEWEFEQLEKIIRMRYRENLFTILTTNLDIKANPQNPKERFVPERIVSRFRDREKGRLVLNQADDYRLEKRKK